MSRFTNRVNRLFAKTHNFFSARDLRLVREYFQDLFEACDKSNEFDLRLEEFRILQTQYRETRDEMVRERMHKLEMDEIGIYYKWMYEGLSNESERYPQGAWLPKSYTNELRTLVVKAKEHFAVNERFR